jgi:hypothetical protein
VLLLCIQGLEHCVVAIRLGDAALVVCGLIQSSSSAGTRGTGHREALGIWWHAPSPVELLVSLAG